MLNKSNYILYFRLYCNDDSFTHSWHTFKQLHEVITWNAVTIVRMIGPRHSVLPHVLIKENQQNKYRKQMNPEVIAVLTGTTQKQNPTNNRCPVSASGSYPEP